MSQPNNGNSSVGDDKQTALIRGIIETHFDEEINFARTEVSQQDDRASGEVDGEGSLSMATTVNLQIQNGVMAVVGG